MFTLINLNPELFEIETEIADFETEPTLDEIVSKLREFDEPDYKLEKITLNHENHFEIIIRSTENPNCFEIIIAILAENR